MSLTINPHYITVAFVIVKLLGIISWSWWWVLAPSLIPIAVMMLTIIVMETYIKWHER